MRLARDLGVRCVAEPSPDCIAKILDHLQSDRVCMAGLMRILSVDVTERHRILNIHPRCCPDAPVCTPSGRLWPTGQPTSGALSA